MPQGPILHRPGESASAAMRGRSRPVSTCIKIPRTPHAYSNGSAAPAPKRAAPHRPHGIPGPASPERASVSHQGHASGSMCRRGPGARTKLDAARPSAEVWTGSVDPAVIIRRATPYRLNKAHVCSIASRRQRDASAHASQSGHCGHIRGSNRPLGVACAARQRAAICAP